MRLSDKTSPIRRASVAWLDDDIANYSGWVDALREADLEVTTFSRQTALLESIGRAHFDLVILDERLREGMGSSLLTLLHSKAPRSRFLFLSGYFVQEDLHAKLRDIHKEAPEITLYALEKSTVGSVGSADFFRLFVEPVAGYAIGELSEDAAPAIASTEVGGFSGRFNISFSEYRDMDSEARHSLSLDFIQSKKSLIDEFFARGAVWLCFFGDSNEPVHIVSSRDDIPNLALVDREAAARGIAPFCVGSPRRIESIQTSVNCSKKAGLKGYSFLGYEVGNQRVRAHFDSGAYDMFLNGGWLIQIGLISDTVSHTTYETSIGVIYGQDEDLDVILEVSNGETMALRYKVIAVRNFEISVLVVNCQLDCGNSRDSICHLRRYGLIGRGILVDNDLRWQVNQDFEVVVVPV